LILLCITANVIDSEEIYDFVLNLFYFLQGLRVIIYYLVLILFYFLQPQVMKFTSSLPMVGGFLRVRWLLPPLKLVAMI